MRPHARAELAHGAYLRALAAARADPTPARWARLRTAAGNLREALRDRDRDDARPRRAGGSAAPAPAARPAGDAPVLALRPWPSQLPVHLSLSAAREALRAECARARRLVAWSRRLVEESRALCAELSALARRAADRPERAAAGLNRPAGAGAIRIRTRVGSETIDR